MNRLDIKDIALLILCGVVLGINVYGAFYGSPDLKPLSAIAAGILVIPFIQFLYELVRS